MINEKKMQKMQFSQNSYCFVYKVETASMYILRSCIALATWGVTKKREMRGEVGHSRNAPSHYISYLVVKVG